MKHKTGSVEVITGSMFCGKTDELIRRLRRASIAKQHVQVFKPQIDDRYAETNIASHAGGQYEATPVTNSEEIRARLRENTTVVAIDEAQFFDNGIIHLANELANKGIRVIVGGLDTDFRAEPFGPMPHIIAQAEKVSKLHAICMKCGEEASRTQRLVDGNAAHYDDPIVIVGADEMYEARCRDCHDVPHG